MMVTTACAMRIILGVNEIHTRYDQDFKDIEPIRSSPKRPSDPG